MRGRSLAPGRALPAKSVNLRIALRNSSPFYFPTFTRSHRFQLSFPLSAFPFRLALDRVHERPLDVVEKNNADKQNRQSETGAVEEVSCVESGTAKVRIAER